MDVATLAHLHLLLNHVPTLGFILGLATLLVALVKKSVDLERFSLEIFVAIALVALLTYTTGYGAWESITRRPAYVEAAVEAHQGAALLSLIIMEITGLMAWIGLWQGRRLSAPPRWIYPVILPLATVATFVVAWAANIGGEITHVEILYSPNAATAMNPGAARWLSNPSIKAFADAYPKVWPVAEIIHFIGLSLLFGVLLVVNLRLLGILKGASFADLHRLLPWGAAGFGVNVMSGMYFFVVYPAQYTHSLIFYLKLVCIVLAGVQLLYLTYFDAPWAIGQGDDPPLVPRVVAASQLILWTGALYFGRMLPYIGGTSTQ